ncbi:MAG: response regulator [Deltaproteobacteria bacterium]|nr:response regulator [Deltaproteobacteria bacterium]
MEKDTAVVLVTDDDPDVLRLSATNLRAAGFTVVEARSGKEALQAFADKPPDAVLLDVMMPHMNGFQTYEAMRKLPGGDTVPVAFFTAHGDNYDTALQLAANDFMQKPVLRERLIERVHALVKAKRFADVLRSGDESGLEKRLATMKQLRETMAEPIRAIAQAAKATLGTPDLGSDAIEHLQKIERHAADLERIVKVLEQRIARG